MKLFLSKPWWLTFLLLLFFFSGCEHSDLEHFSVWEEYIYHEHLGDRWERNQLPRSDTFLAVHHEEDDFYLNFPGRHDHSVKHIVCIFDNHDDYKGRMYEEGGMKIWVDARNPDGYSTWSHPRTTRNGEYCTIKYIASSQDEDRDKYYTYYQVLIVFSSPPAHLHLCLDSLTENVLNEIPSKTWKIADLSDLNGESLADDPDWWYYTDNRMKFEKTTKFTFWPGEDRSTEEIDMFGTLEEHAIIFGSYAIKEDNNKTVTLTISFPSFQQDLMVVSSSWTELILKGIRNNKTGILRLVPDTI